MDSLHLSPYIIYLTGMPIHTPPEGDRLLLCRLEVVKERSRSCVLQLFSRLKRDLEDAKKHKQIQVLFERADQR